MTLFPAKQKDLPTVLALAQGAQSSHERSVFSATFARHAEEKSGNAQIKILTFGKAEILNNTILTMKTLAIGIEIFFYKGYGGNAPSNRQKTNITTQEQEYTDDYGKHAQVNIGEIEDDLLPT